MQISWEFKKKNYNLYKNPKIMFLESSERYMNQELDAKRINLIGYL